MWRRGSTASNTDRGGIVLRLRCVLPPQGNRVLIESQPYSRRKYLGKQGEAVIPAKSPVFGWAEVKTRLPCLPPPFSRRLVNDKLAGCFSGRSMLRARNLNGPRISAGAVLCNTRLVAHSTVMPGLRLIHIEPVQEPEFSHIESKRNSFKLNLLTEPPTRKVAPF